MKKDMKYSLLFVNDDCLGKQINPRFDAVPEASYIYFNEKMELVIYKCEEKYFTLPLFQVKLTEDNFEQLVNEWKSITNLNPPEPERFGVWFRNDFGQNVFAVIPEKKSK